LRVELDQLKEAQAEVTSRKLAIGVVQLAKNDETLYGKTQLNDYLKVENESVEQPSIEEVDTTINELENKLDCLVATRAGMQTTGDVIDSHMRQSEKIKKNRIDSQELSRLNGKINDRVNELNAHRDQYNEKRKVAVKSIKQITQLIKVLDESTKNECDTIEAESVSKESKIKITAYNKILLELGCRYKFYRFFIFILQKSNCQPK